MNVKLELKCFHLYVHYIKSKFTQLDACNKQRSLTVIGSCN